MSGMNPISSDWRSNQLGRSITPVRSIASDSPESTSTWDNDNMALSNFKQINEICKQLCSRTSEKLNSFVVGATFRSQPATGATYLKTKSTVNPFGIGELRQIILDWPKHEMYRYNFD